MSKEHDMTEKSQARICLLDWLKGWAIVAVVLDHLKILPEPYVVWSVNIFVLVTAAIYSKPGYVFSAPKFTLKLFHLFYMVVFALLAAAGLYRLAGIHVQNSVLSILKNPYFFFEKNEFLGHIWYVALHVQILIVLFLFLKIRSSLKPVFVFLGAAVLSPLSYFVTHYIINHYQTILISSWFLFLAFGFYALPPFLKKIETAVHNRWLWLCFAFTMLLSIYSLLPFYPQAFTSDNRTLFVTLPFYFALILFLGELFFLLNGPVGEKIIKPGFILLGHYTLAVYLMHSAFARIWGLVFSSPLLLAGLAVGSSVVFGILADKTFKTLEKAAENLKCFSVLSGYQSKV